MAKENEGLIKEYRFKLDQSKRNIAQGELGRSLAEGKISEIKQKFAQLDKNLKEEAETIGKEIEFDEANNKDELASQKKNLVQVTTTSENVLKDIATVQELSKDLVTENQGKDADQASQNVDMDLTSSETGIKHSIAQAKESIDKYGQQLTKKAADDLAKQEQGDKGPFRKDRTSQEKDEMAAFLAGN